MSNPKTRLDTETIRANPPVNLNLTEAALYLGISPRMLWGEANAGRVRAARFGNRLIFTRAELDRVVAVKMAAA